VSKREMLSDYVEAYKTKCPAASDRRRWKTGERHCYGSVLDLR